MDFDNERDRYASGFDAGQIVDGVVQLDGNTGRYVLVDDSGMGYDPQAVLEHLEGQKIRITIIRLDAIADIENMISGI